MTLNEYLTSRENIADQFLRDGCSGAFMKVEEVKAVCQVIRALIQQRNFYLEDSYLPSEVIEGKTYDNARLDKLLENI